MLRHKLARIPGWLLVGLYSLIVLVPLYFILVSSLKTNAEIIQTPFSLPTNLDFSNYWDVLKDYGIVPAFANSLLVSLGATALQLILGIVITYCLYKTRNNQIGKILYMIVLITMFIPGTGWVTLIRLYQKLKLYNSLWGLILHSGTGRLAFNMFILFGAMRAVPGEMEEAAILDGCNDRQYLFRVLLPCIRPSVISIAIFSFTTSWNNLMIPLLMIRDSANYTIPMALRFFQSAGGGEVFYNYIFAGIVLSGLPLLIMYLFCQKYFVAALTGSVKG